MGKVLENKLENPARRNALKRLAGAMVPAYVAPQILFLSAAKAETISAVSGVSGSSGPSGVGMSGPSGPLPTDAPEDDTVFVEPDDDAADPRETCNPDGRTGSEAIQITRSDMNRSREAIDAGYARPLEQIWAEFIDQYDGRIVGVEFTGRRKNPRYKFRAISQSGRLETVVISAQTGEILRITGC